MSQVFHSAGIPLNTIWVAEVIQLGNRHLVSDSTDIPGPADGAQDDVDSNAIASRVLTVASWDARAFAWSSRRGSRFLDFVLPRLTHLCDDGRLWAWISVLLALFAGRRGRRAARAGILSLAVASPVVNGPIKWIVRRPRPPSELVPEVRRIRNVPRTTSFPSGHSASAWCYSVAASLEAPILAPVLLPLAAAIAYSRVYTGAHYPGDAIAGSIVGAGMGAWLGPRSAALGAAVSRLVEDAH